MVPHVLHNRDSKGKQRGENGKIYLMNYKPKFLKYGEQHKFLYPVCWITPKLNKEGHT